MKLNFNFKLSSANTIASGSKLKLIASSMFYTLIIWLVVFVFETILISGGLYAKGIPFIIVELIAVVVSMLIYSKRMDLNRQSLIASIISVIIFYAILDFLVVNLVLQKNDLSIYKFWAYYLKYVLIVAVPFLRSKLPAINVPNLKLPLTKQS